MRIRVLSDLHLEGYKFQYDYAGEDVVALAGDIHTNNRHEQLLRQIPENIPVILIAGNHEYYHSSIQDVNDCLSCLKYEFQNVHFLNNDSVIIDNVSFFGGTGWSNFRLDSDDDFKIYLAMKEASHYISDFRYIDNGKFTPTDCVELSNQFDKALLAWKKTVPDTVKKVVLTHFLPSRHSISKRFATSPVNAYFASAKDHLLEDDVDLCIHGHTHDSFDYYIGKTRVVCNPKGYGSENSYFYSEYIIEI